MENNLDPVCAGADERGTERKGAEKDWTDHGDERKASNNN